MKIDIVVDCADPQALAAFWAEVLGYENKGFSEPYVLLHPPENSALSAMIFQRVPEEKQGKNRMHFDVLATDIEAEAARLQARGATRVSPEPLTHGPARWIVMNDPEGNEFCVCKS